MLLGTDFAIKLEYFATVRGSMQTTRAWWTSRALVTLSGDLTEAFTFSSVRSSVRGELGHLN